MVAIRRKEAEALGGGCGVEIWWLRTEGEGVSGGIWRGMGWTWWAATVVVEDSWVPAG